MYYFIVNPHSRSGKGKQIWNRLKKQLDQSTIQYQAFLTDHRGHARELTASLTAAGTNEEDKIIIAVGGDGTLNEVVDGLHVASHVTLGFIATGSGNDFSRGMKLPKNPKKALQRILHPRYFRFLDYGVLSCDVSDINHHRFVVSSGIGYDAEVCYEINTSPFKRFLCHIHLSKLSYVCIGIHRLLCLKPVDGYLILDGNKKITLKHAAFVSTHIHKCEGGGFRFAPKADPCDGQFDLCVITHVNRRRMVPALILAIFGHHTCCNIVRTYRCHDVSIHLDSPRTVHADGENMGSHTDVSLSCRSKQLRFIV